jgi:hypothetical protein
MEFYMKYDLTDQQWFERNAKEEQEDISITKLSDALSREAPKGYKEDFELYVTYRSVRAGKMDNQRFIKTHETCICNSISRLPEIASELAYEILDKLKENLGIE